MVQRIWSEVGLQPHRVDNFKVSNDPRFTDKLIDVVGLYLNPPDQALAMCMDEKSQLQAMDRTQASLPMVKGRAGRMTDDDKRNGTTTLFAALDVLTLTGTVIGQCLPRHRHDEFLVFLRTVDLQLPQEPAGPPDPGQLRHPPASGRRAVTGPAQALPPALHPTSSSWLNQVERWFRELTDKNLRRAVFGSVPDLIASIKDYLDAHNSEPQRYVWTATAEQILAKVQRARTTPRPGACPGGGGGRRRYAKVHAGMVGLDRREDGHVAR